MKRLLITLSVAAALWSAACGSAGSSVQPPPPSGKYSLASLNGTYAFVTNGEVITGNTASPMAASPRTQTASDRKFSSSVKNRPETSFRLLMSL